MLKIPKKGTPEIDAIFAILLLIATLSTAFSVYQATRWNGIQAVEFGDSSQFRTESIRATTLANSEVIVDVQLFTSWVNAMSKGDTLQAKFIEERFRKEFIPAFEAWKAQASKENPIPAGTPLSLPEYTLTKYDESIQLEEQASSAFTRGKEANQNGDNYISQTVLFAIVLFFCGVYSKWESRNIRLGILVVTLFIFSFALYSLGTLFFRVGFV